jgi:hypothetical protein
LEKNVVMSTVTIGLIIFACVAGSTLLGMVLGRILPTHHLSGESKDVVKLGMGLIGTMSALVLGLLVGSAKSAYDAQKSNLAQMSVKLVILDRALAHYGKEAQEAREILKAGTARILDQMWPEDRSQPAQLDPKLARAEVLYDKIQALSPKNETQRSFQNQALGFAVDIGQLRWLMFQQSGSAISTPLLVVLTVWLCVTFAGFGLMAPVNPTTIAVLLLCAVSIAGAVFLILELDRPFDGMIQIPSTPLHNALAMLGQ